MERKFFQLKNLNTNEEGIFEGYASTFNNVDLEGDMIIAGAFRDTLLTKNHQVVLLYQHQHETPIGVVKLYEDEVGLYAKGELNLNVQKAREVYSLLQQGALDAMSIGFQAKDYEIDGEGIRHLKELSLLEVSIVTFPANPEARLLAVKAPCNQHSEEIIREIELLNQNIEEMF